MFEVELENGIVFQIEQDDFEEGAYHIRLKQGAIILSQIHLMPLDSLNTFQAGDYYFKTFNSYPKRSGYGRMLINTLRLYHNNIPAVQNIYSTSWGQINAGDTDFFSPDARIFWERLVASNLAIERLELNRYQLILNP